MEVSWKVEEVLIDVMSDVVVTLCADFWEYVDTSEFNDALIRTVQRLAELNLGTFTGKIII